MKKILIVLLAIGSLSSFAQGVSSCYFGFANERLDKKMTMGIATLGIGTLIDQAIPEMGVAAATELLTEAIAQNEELAPLYLKEIQDGAFGAKLERIIEKKKDKRLNRMVNNLRDEGHLRSIDNDSAKQVVATNIVKLIHSYEICKSEAKSVRKIEDLVINNL
jgi:hypothetical protein